MKAVSELHGEYQVEFINSSPNNLDPFQPIKKVESFTHNGNLTGYGIEVLTPNKNGDEDWVLTGTVGASYLLVENREIMERGFQVIESSGLSFEHSRIWTDGKRFQSNWVITDFEIDIIKKFGVDTGLSEDKFQVGFLIRNSYDGSWAASAQIYINRLVCGNGMMSKQMLGQYRFKHLNGNADWGTGMDECTNLLSNSSFRMEEMLGLISRLPEKQFNQDNLTAIRKRKNNPITAGVFGRVVDSYLLNGEHKSMYGLYNAGTSAFWNDSKLKAGDMGNNELWTTDFLSLVKEN